MPAKAPSVKARFRAKRLTAAEIAKKLRVHPSTVQRTLNGQIAKPDPRITKAIARALGEPVESLFPARAA
jgi:transcriptional regulator with XRE-family HTH domain